MQFTILPTYLSTSGGEAPISPGPIFVSKLSDDFSPLVEQFFSADDTISKVVNKLFSTTIIAYQQPPQLFCLIPGTHAVGGSYTPGKLTIFPFLYHATHPDNPEEVIRLTTSKLMQEYAHVLQGYAYKTHGYYLRYVRDFIRCHIAPLFSLHRSKANLKSSYRNPNYFEGEAHQLREPLGHLLFVLSYIHEVTGLPMPSLQDNEAINAYINPNTHHDIAPEHATMIARFFSDYFDEFLGREELTPNQIITRSPHLSDYPAAKAWQEKAGESGKNLSIPDSTHEYAYVYTRYFAIIIFFSLRYSVTFLHVYQVARPSNHNFVRNPKTSPINAGNPKVSLNTRPTALPNVSAGDFFCSVSNPQATFSDIHIAKTKNTLICFCQ